MARNKGKAEKAAVNGNGKAKRATGPVGELAADDFVSAPEGFEQVFGERVVGWWALIAGNAIRGKLVDVFETKSKFNPEGKKVYKIEVTDGKPGPKGCIIHPADSDAEDDGTTFAKVGDVIGVDEKGFLKALARLAVGQEIFIGYRGKEAPSPDYPQGRHVFVGPFARPAKGVHPVTGEVMT